MTLLATDRPSQVRRRLSLADVTALLALGGVALYVVGLVRTVGLLHAEGVDVTRGVPLAPLQDYLLRGLGVVVAPRSLLQIAIAVLLLGVAITSARWAALVDEEGGSSENVQNILFGLFYLALVGLGFTPFLTDNLELAPLLVVPFSFVLIVPPVEWIPAIVPTVLAVAVAWLAKLSGLLGDELGTWSRAHARVAAAAIAAWLLVAALLSAYLAPPPLDRARIETTSGERLAGGLLTLTASAAYLVEDGAAARIRVIPVASMRSLWVSEGRPRHYRSIAEQLGADLK
ncbi:MAG TPA: hypothetical protein VFS37_06095 [Conexibacter sp.]|nr:hypothetical protein [Conexibacter sp.]